MHLFRRLIKQLSSKSMSATAVRQYHVAVLGGATEIGQISCLMLRSEPAITKLTVHDNLPYTKGVIIDLSHIPSPTIVDGFIGNDSISKALQDVDIILAVGGSTESPNMNKNDMFNNNADYIKSFALNVARLRPMPFVGIVTEPINSMVPMAAEILKCHGDYNPRKLFGITAVDSFRAQTMYAQDHYLNARDCSVPVICGHSEKTIIPLLSQAYPIRDMDSKHVHDLTNRVRGGEDAITETKLGWGPSLSIAYSVSVFTRGILNALHGNVTPVNAFVENNDFGTNYFSGLVYVDKDGFTDMHRYTSLSKYECDLLEHSIAQLRIEVSSGRKMLEVE